ncbi:MAG: hypothetical protein CL917_09975 [Deltaproteobacteria bacterium]|nr:hypothetical protein [Deltaproteobacteria bacterium]
MVLPVTTAALVGLLVFVFLAISAVLTLRPTVATLFVVFFSTLFLPLGTGFDFPGMPSLNGRNLPYLILTIGVLAVWPQRIRGIGFGRSAELLIVVTCLAPLVTVYFNGSPVVWGPRVNPGLTNWDGFSSIIRGFISGALPFLVGRFIFRRSEDLRLLMLCFAAAGLIYSLFALVELRMSPQFHRWVYDYQASGKFVHKVRFGGYRPTVFLSTGLALALFFVNSSLAAFALGRVKMHVLGLPSRLAAPYLLVVLVLCKSLAAILYGVLAAPLVALMSAKWIHRVALMIALVVLIYPVLRSQGLFPANAVIQLGGLVGKELSLTTRFTNEDRLLEWQLNRFFFGWGGHARGRVFNDKGKDISITDGQWILLLSTGGFVMWAAHFGLLLWPVFLAIRKLPRIRGPDQILISTLLLMISIFSLDQLPNGMFLNFCFVLSGAAVTLLKMLPHEASEVQSGLTTAESQTLVAGSVDQGGASPSLSGGLLRKALP